MSFLGNLALVEPDVAAALELVGRADVALRKVPGAVPDDGAGATDEANVVVTVDVDVVALAASAETLAAGIFKAHSFSACNSVAVMHSGAVARGNICSRSSGW